jgi:hypothetical protein
MKICLLVLSSDWEFKPLVDSVRNTWGHSSDGVDVWYYYGNRENQQPLPTGSVKIDGNNIICGVNESVAAVLDKTLLAFDYLNNNYDYDFYFRCCAGSYVLKDQLFEKCKTLPKMNCYYGRSSETPPPKNSNSNWEPVNVLGPGGQPIGGHISGSGVLFSRDIVTKMLKDLDRGNVGNQFVLRGNNQYGAEDASYGKWCRDHGYSKSKEHSTLDICDTDEPIKTAINNYGKYFHLHFRHNTNIMYELHETIKGLSK